MNLAVTEVRRAKLRFGLLTGAVALLVFLVLLLSTLSSSLVRSFTGALEGLDTQVLVYSDTARDNLQGSRLDPSVVDAVAAVPGVEAAAGLATLTTAGDLPAGREDLQLFGFAPGGPGEPTGLTAGRLPEGANEAAVDAAGVEVGDTVVLQPTGTELSVVGLLRGSRFSATATAYVDLDTYDEVVRAANPDVPFVPLNAVAVDVTAGSDPAAVAAAHRRQVPGTTGYTRSDAVAKIPGVESVSQTFGILVGLTFVIGIVVIGFFFLILTVQKMRSFTLLRAIGASTARLSVTVAAQITLVVLLASRASRGPDLLAVRA